MLPVFGIYLALRLGDLAWRGQLGALFSFDTYSVVALVELALFVAAPLMLLSSRQRNDFGNLFRAAMVLVLGGSLYRINTFLVAFNPGPQWSYFPSVGEIFVTVGLLAIEVLAYFLIVTHFPILAGYSKQAARPLAA
jgi:Ni/Fe-hydrogenase subunit HybB-like protein